MFLVFKSTRQWTPASAVDCQHLGPTPALRVAVAPDRVVDTAKGAKMISNRSISELSKQKVQKEMGQSIFSL